MQAIESSLRYFRQFLVVWTACVKARKPAVFCSRSEIQYGAKGETATVVTVVTCERMRDVEKRPVSVTGNVASSATRDPRVVL